MNAEKKHIFNNKIIWKTYYLWAMCKNMWFISQNNCDKFNLSGETK